MSEDRMHCLVCSHLLEVHDVVGQTDDGRELLTCTERGCRCELVEGEC